MSSRSHRAASVVAVAACALALVAAPAQAKAKATPCTRSLKINTSAFSAKLNLGAKTGFSDNAIARARLTKSLKSAAARYNSQVRTANASCTRDVKVAAIARDSAIRRAKSTLARAVARQKYAVAAVNAQATREDAVYRAFLGWVRTADSAYGVYDAATNSPTTASARAEFRRRTAAAAANLSAKISTAATNYLARRTAAGVQLRAALSAAGAMSDRNARSVATLTAWDAYVNGVKSAQRSALSERAGALPEATSELETAHAEFEVETETSGPTTNTPEPGDSPEPTSSPAPASLG